MFHYWIKGTETNEKKTEDKLTKATRDCSRTSIELIHGLMAQLAKDRVFNKVGLTKPKRPVLAASIAEEDD